MKRLIAFLIVCLSSVPAFAWIDTGHMVVAAVAEPLLTPQAKKQVAELVKIGADDRTNTFITASCYADDYKSDKDRNWHFINIHFRTDGAPTSNQPLEENVAWAIKKFTKVLADKSKSKEERAEALRYLIHFVGDVHQPLHSVARDSDEYPSGDRGGNDFKIAPIEGWGDRPLQNLHVLWDFGCGAFLPVPRPLNGTDEQKIRTLAQAISKEFPKTQFRDSDNPDVDVWVNESLGIAKSTVYTTPVNGKPSAAYLEAGKTICKRRAALAGYRLANLLNRALR